MLRGLVIVYFVWLVLSAVLGLASAVVQVLDSRRAEPDKAPMFRKLAVLYFAWSPLEIAMAGMIYWFWKNGVIDDSWTLCYVVLAVSVIETLFIVIKYRIRKIPFFPVVRSGSG